MLFLGLVSGSRDAVTPNRLRTIRQAAVRSVMVLVLSSVLAACTSSQVEEDLAPPVRTSHIDAPTVVLWTDTLAGKNTAACIQKSLETANPKLQFVTPQTWREALFPWFETQTMPITDEGLASLFRRRLVQERLRSVDIDYFVVITSTTRSPGDQGEDGTVDRPDGLILCGFSGCLGLAYGDRETKIEARLWDIARATFVGEVGSRASGTVIVPAFVLPVPFIPPTKTTACTQMAHSLAAYLAGTEDPPIDR